MLVTAVVLLVWLPAFHAKDGTVDLVLRASSSVSSVSNASNVVSGGQMCCRTKSG